MQLRALEREAKAQRDLFESCLAKYREATARDSIAAAPADARIISRAVVSNIAYFPKKMPIVIIAGLGTFSLATAFVVTGALLSGDSPRPAQAPQPHQPAAPVAQARPANARSRASDRLPVAPNLAASLVPASSAASPSIDEIAAALHQSDEGGRCVAVIGIARDVGTTLTAIALARTLSRTARVVLVDLAFASPNINVISDDPAAPGMAELVRGSASFGDIITRDLTSRAHLVAAGNIGNDAQGLLQSQMLWAAIGALAQSYDHLVIDAGAHSATALGPISAIAPFAVLVGGATASTTLSALAGQLQATGFTEVAVLTGPPPALEEPAGQSGAQSAA